ncbi:MAG: transposase family protein [Candidatus Cloacimonetes bacterium]|nr:transposase family protein [Candidatus Cloacimonadota bacterium]
MDKLESVRQKSPEDFLRDIGFPLDIFWDIAQKVSNYIKDQKEKRPITKRGLKARMSIENKLLLTIYYMRHYMTFARLGEEFNISESYANKIFHKITDILVKILKLKSRNELLNSELGTLLIDASEQPIERPQNKQKKYYSGKKTAYCKDSISC